MPRATERIEEALRIDPAVAERKIVGFIRRKLRSSGAGGLVIGLSGGLDSSVCAALSAKAIPPGNILGVFMPERSLTPEEDREDVRRLVAQLGIEVREVEISGILRAFESAVPDFDSRNIMAWANLKPRIRMAILYYYANLLNRLVVGTSNKTELRIGYFTKFGDGAADLLPIGCLYKTQVRALARHLGLPEGILQKTPTAGLWRGQTDEGEIGISYDKLDRILAGEELGLRPEQIAEAAGVQLETVRGILRRVEASRHKILPPPAPRL